jgi:hypothetical protein
VEPLTEVEVNVPGVIAIVVAPLVTQLSMVLVPEFMVAGLALNDVIAGTGPPVVFRELPTAAQPLKPRDATRSNASTKSFGTTRFGMTGRHL